MQLGVTVAGLALGWIGEPAVAEIILNLLRRHWLHRLPEPMQLLYAHTGAVIISRSR